MDWVGTDVYAKFSNTTLWTNLRALLPRLSAATRSRSASTAPWDNDYSGEFTRRIHKWARDRPRVDALLYFRSVDPQNNFNLQHYKGAKRSLRRLMNRRRYAPYAPGTRDGYEGPGGGGISP